MKCPICGETLRPGKKDPNYLLCYNCRKKFKAPQKKEPSGDRKSGEQKYSNIPPKAVREKRETEMKKAYDDMLAVGDGKKKKKKADRPDTSAKTRRKEEIYDDDPYDDYEGGSMAPIIILGIAILGVAAAIAYMVFFR